MKILVTGVDGFLGQAIQRELARDGHEIVGLSVGPRVMGHHHFCDIRNRGKVDHVFRQERPALCVHLAGVAHADVSSVDESRVRSINVDGALNVARAAVAAGTRQMIYFSTAKVYGDSTPSEGVREEAPPCPGDIYGRLKREAEQQLCEFGEEKGISIAIVRPVAVFGPGDSRGNYARLARVAQRGVLPWVAAAEVRRSVAFVDRVADRVARMAKHSFVHGRSYVFSDGAYELKEVIKEMRRSTPGVVVPLPIPVGWARMGSSGLDWFLEGVLGRKGPFRKMVRRFTESFVIITHRFEQDFGDLPRFSLRQAMMKTCAVSQVS